MAERERPPRIVVAVPHADGLQRCPWPGADPLYLAYHDEEWGAPEYDDRALFEKLVLDGFQAGLSWITILRKRTGVPAGVRRLRAGDDRALGRGEEGGADGGPRHRAQSRQDRSDPGARPHLSDLMGRGGFARHLWSFVGGRPIQPERKSLADVPVESEESRAMAKDLRARGGNFVGPTIVYAFMQATGMVNDHLVGCCRHEPCRALARDFAE